MTYKSAPTWVPANVYSGVGIALRATSLVVETWQLSDRL